MEKKNIQWEDLSNFKIDEDHYDLRSIGENDIKDIFYGLLTAENCIKIELRRK